MRRPPHASRPRPLRPDATAEATEARGFADRYLLVFVREPTLWPVLIVVLCHVAVFVAPVLLLGLRDGQRSALGVLALLVVATLMGSGPEIRRRRRPGAVTGLFAASWVLSVFVAFVANRYGVF